MDDEQEPIGWMVYTLDGTAVYVTDNPADFTENHRALPLYTAPPTREWVGMTDEEIDKAWRSVDYTVPYNQFRIDVARAIEAKLKEKNQ